MPFARRRLALALVPALLAAGCSTPESGRESTSSFASDALEVGVVPVIDVAPLYLGIRKGFFAEERLAVTPKLAQGGSAIVAAVVSGRQNIGFSNNTSLLVAASKQAPIRIVAAGNQAAAGDYAVVLAKSGSAISTPEDLEGKRIAVNSLSNVGSLTINAALQAGGADIETVKYVEIPFPQMGAALAKGQVDAAWAVEPFASTIKAAGGVTPVLRPYPLIAPHFPVASYFTNTQFAKNDPGIVARFHTAMNRSLTYAQSHPTEVRAILTSFIKLSPEVAERVVLPEWSTDVDIDLLTRTSELAREYGYLKTAPDVRLLVGR